MKLADLKLNPDNPRNIKPEKLDKLAQSIKDFPKMMVKRPIVYDENKIIIGGNMRYKAIEKLGMTEIPDEWTGDASDFTPEERQRFIMQDNAEMGEHDWDMVANQYELEDLDAWGIDVPYADATDEVEEDEAPEVSSEPPVSQLGVVYQLGRHRVMCGDSLKDVNKLLGGVQPDMVFTDPPYGMDYSGRGKETSNKILNDNIDPTGFYNIGSHISERYIWGRVENYKHLSNEPRDIIIWKKNNFGMGRGYRGQYECCFYYGDFSGSDSDVWELPKDTKYEHPTQKPVGLCARAIKNSQPNIVIDYFLGSGSTLIACEQTDRTCYGMELDPKYTDVIRRRYWKFVNNGDETGWEENTPAVDVK